MSQCVSGYNGHTQNPSQFHIIVSSVIVSHKTHGCPERERERESERERERGRERGKDRVRGRVRGRERVGEREGEIE